MPFGFGSIGGVGDIVAFVKLSGADKFNNDLDRLNQRVSNSGQVMNRAMNATLLAGAAAFTAATVAASKFEAQMADVNTLLDVSEKEFENLNQGVLNIAKTVPTSMSTLTKGLYDLISAGAESSQSISALDLAARAATAGISGVDVAVRAGMATINAYALDIGELSRIYDLQFSTVKKGVLTYAELSNAIGNVLPSASNLGVVLEDLYGSIAAVTKAGIDAQSATTYLARAFESMTENREKWEALGVAIFDATGKFRGLEPVIGDLAKSLQGATVEQRIMKLEALDMEKRAAKAILTMVNNYKGFKKTLDAVADSQGAMNDAFEKQMDTFKAQAGIIKNNLQVAFIELGRSVLPVLTDMFRELNKHPETIRTIVSVVGKLVITLGGATAALKGVRLAMSAVKGIQALWMASFGPFGIAIAGVTAGLIALNEIANKRHEQALAQIDAIGEEINEVRVLSLRYDELKDKAVLTRAESEELKTITEKLTKAFEAQGLDVSNLTGALTQLTPLYLKLRKIELQEALSEVERKIGAVAMKTNVLATALGGPISLFSGLRDIVDDTQAGALKRLNNQAEDLKSRLEELENPLATTSTEVENVGDVSKNAGDKISSTIKPIYDMAIKTKELKSAMIDCADATLQHDEHVKAYEEHLRKANDTTQKANNNWIDFARLIGDVTDRMEGDFAPAIGNIANLIASFASPSATFLNIFNIFGAIFDAFTGKTGTLKVSIDELKESFGALGDEIERAQQSAEDLGNVISSALAQQTSQVLDDTLQRAADLATEIKRFELLEVSARRPSGLGGINWVNPYTERLKDLRIEYEATQKEIEGLTNSLLELSDAFQFEVGFEKQAEDLGTLTEQALKMRDYFGDIEWPGLETLLQETIDQSRIMLDDLDPTSQAYVDLSDSIKEAELALGILNGTIDQETLDIIKKTENEIEALTQAISDWEQEQANIDEQLKRDIEGINNEIESLNKTITDLKQQRIEIDIQLAQDILPYQTKLSQLQTTLMGFREIPSVEGIDFYQLSKAIDELTGRVNKLTIDWGNMLDVMFQDYDQFEKDIQTATSAIEKILYFDIDLETTTADEQIAGLIFRMQDYLKTLSPGSKAYEDANKALETLTQKFEDMGGELDKEKALAIETDAVDSAIADAQTIIDNFILEAESKKAEIDIDIIEAENKIRTLKGDIISLINEAESRKLVIDANIQVAQYKIETLINKLSELRSKTITIDVNAPSGMHIGGIVEAHQGLVLGSTYKGRKEVLIKGLEGEAVIRPEVGDMYSSKQWERFNRTGNPAVFGNTQDTGRAVVVINQPGPRTNAQIYRDSILPEKLYAERFLEPAGDVF